MGLGFSVSGLGFGVWGLGFGVGGLGFGVSAFRVRNKGVGFRVRFASSKVEAVLKEGPPSYTSHT